MKHEVILQALGEIRDAFIGEAAGAKKKRRPYWLGAVAAVLAVVILMKMPMFIQAHAVSLASEPRIQTRPDIDDYDDTDQWRLDYAAFDAQRNARSEAAAAANRDLNAFFAESSRRVLSDPTGNSVWSPANAYIALAALAETTGGESQQQIMDLLNVSDIDTLRARTSAVWEEVYKDDGHEISKLATSLWLNKGLDYDQDTMDSLAYHYYTSVYQQDLGSSRAGKDLQAWLNNSTGGLLKDAAGSAAFPEDAVMTLASTVYMQAKWYDEFSSSKNTTGPFHSPVGDIDCTFMNKQLQTDYYWGDSFGAVALNLKNGTAMWFFLPDEDKTVGDVLAEGQYLDLLCQYESWLGYQDMENSKYMKVNLSVPKFDISYESNIQSALQEMGLTDIFDIAAADFTAITSDSPVYITGVNQATRVIIDEQGVKAATYIEFPGAGAAAPPDEVIDFVLDRPFLFVIADYSGIPLFTGVVNQPQ